MNNVQERLPGAIATPTERLPEWLTGAGTQNAAISPGALGNDRIRQMLGPQIGNSLDGGIADTGLSQMSGGASGLLSQLLSIVQQLMSMVGLGGGSGEYFQNATASSTGDPHLAFTGTDASGATEQSHFDSMTGHADLLDSDSFAGGYQISTNTTQPGTNGVTYNQQATIATNYGQTQISLDNRGDAYITGNGEQYALAPGQSYTAGNGETVTRNNDGSVVVTDTNAQGGSITTTLSQNGNGVDVRTQAQGVDLGGDLTKQGLQRHSRHHHHHRPIVMSPQNDPNLL